MPFRMGSASLCYSLRHHAKGSMLLLDYFNAYGQKAQEIAELEREKKVQRTMLDIKRKFGKNAILKGMNLQEGATAKDRNNTIGGHRSR